MTTNSRLHLLTAGIVGGPSRERFQEFALSGFLYRRCLPSNSTAAFRLIVVFFLWLGSFSACNLTMGDQPLTVAEQAADVQVYRVGELWTGDGQQIRDAMLVVQDGKIRAVGPASEIEVPAGSVVHQHPTLVMIPGLLLAETSLAEGGEDDELAVTPQVRAIDGFDFFEPRPTFLAAGITTVQLAPGSARLMPGQGSVVKMAGDDLEQRVLKRSESFRILLTQAAFNPPTVYDPPVGAVSETRPLLPTQPQLAGTLSGAISGLQALFDAAKLKNGGGNVAANLNEHPIATLHEALDSQATFRITARSNAEVFAALQICRDYQLPAILVQPQSGETLKQLDWSDDQWRGVILSPGVRPGRLAGIWGVEDEEDGPRPVAAWDVAAALVQAGAQRKLAVRLESDQDVVHVRYLAALFQQGGLSAQQVLRMLTDNPARIMGVADRVGRLAVGLDADFVLLSGTPLASASRVEATFVNGKKVYEIASTEQTLIVGAGQVYAGGQVIPQGRVAIHEGKVTSVGTQVSAPLDSKLEIFPDAVIVPGFVDMGTAVGWGGPVSERLALQIKVGDFLAVEDNQMAAARRGGITTGLLSSTSLPSPVVAFKLGDRPRVLKDPVAIRYEIRGNLTQVESSMRRTLQSGKTYHESWVKYEAEYADYQAKLKQYEADLAKYQSEKMAREAAKSSEAAGAPSPNAPSAGAPSAEENAPSTGARRTPTQGSTGRGSAGQSSTVPAAQEGRSASSAVAPPGEAKPADEEKAADEPAPPTKPTEPQKPRAQEALEPYRALFRNEIHAIVDVADAPSIRLALKLFRQEFQLSTVLSGGSGVEQVADEVAKSGARYVVGSELVGNVDGRVVNYPQLLAQAQIPFGFQSRAAAESAGLPYWVGFAVHQGLADGDALCGLTESPAEFLGLQCIGRLAPGLDADLVVLSGPPFDPASRVLAVMIDGRWVFRRGAQP